MAAKKSPKPAVKKRTVAPPPPGMGRDEKGNRREGGAWRTNARIAAAEERKTKQSGPARTSGRAPIRGAGKAATTSAIDAAINRQMAGMSSIARDYAQFRTKNTFVSEMMDALTEGDLSRFPSKQWEPKAEKALGLIYDRVKPKKKK